MADSINTRSQIRQSRLSPIFLLKSHGNRPQIEFQFFHPLSRLFAYGTCSDKIIESRMFYQSANSGNWWKWMAVLRAGLRVGGATFDWYTAPHNAIRQDDESLIS
jgi:hypothetical protein